MKIALTGHRSERLRGKECKVSCWVEDILNKFAEGQDESVICYCGCAEGADEIFGRATHFVLGTYLVLCKPYAGYRLGDIDWLNAISSEIICVADSWSNAADDLRDKYMVDNCDILLAVWDGIKAGGVWSTIKYAKKLGKPIIYFPRSILIGEDEED